VLLKAIPITLFIMLMFGCGTVHKNGMYQTKRYKLGKSQFLSLKKSSKTDNFLVRDTLCLLSTKNLQDISCAESKTDELILKKPYKLGTIQKTDHREFATIKVSKIVPQPLDTLINTNQNAAKSKLEDTIWYSFGLITIGVGLILLSGVGFLSFMASYSLFFGIAFFIYGIVELISFLARSVRNKRTEKRKLNHTEEEVKPKKKTIWNTKFITGLIFITIGILSGICALSFISLTATSSILFLFQLAVLIGCTLSAIFFLSLGFVMLSIGLEQYNEVIKKTQSTVGKNG